MLSEKKLKTFIFFDLLVDVNQATSSKGISAILFYKSIIKSLKISINFPNLQLEELTHFLTKVS